MRGSPVWDFSCGLLLLASFVLGETEKLVRNVCAWEMQVEGGKGRSKIKVHKKEKGVDWWGKGDGKVIASKIGSPYRIWWKGREGVRVETQFLALSKNKCLRYYDKKRKKGEEAVSGRKEKR
jgi:hypothetical protein